MSLTAEFEGRGCPPTCRLRTYCNESIIPRCHFISQIEKNFCKILRETLYNAVTFMALFWNPEVQRNSTVTVGRTYSFSNV
jgi:hypothetical protein